MNKKGTMISSLVLGGALIIGGVAANASQLSGYDTYKQAIKDTKNITNGTATLALSVTDNGKKVVDVSGTLKRDDKANTMSSALTAQGLTANEYKQDGKDISKTSASDQYLVKTEKVNKGKKGTETLNPQLQQSAEVIVDTLVGSMKDGVAATNNGDGTKTVKVNLTENQISPLVNAGASIAFNQEKRGAGADSTDKTNDKVNMENLKGLVPQLQSGIKVVSVVGTATVNKDDVITDQSATIVLSGNDAQGVAHTVQLDVKVDLTDINSTTPDKVDLTGKNVKTVTEHSRGGKNE